MLQVRPIHVGVHQSFRHCLLLLAFFITTDVLAQQPYSPRELKKHFQNVAEDYVMTSEGKTIELRKAPIFYWTNNERELLNGSTYVWESNGRPLVLGSIFTYVWAGQTHCRHELLSLTDQPVSGTLDSDIVWSPQSSDLQWQTIADAPPPNESSAKRLIQMRTLARRFSGTLRITDQQPTELRLISQPIIRYQPSEGNVTDAAIFAYAVATDAEILVAIEARRDSEGNVEYVYAAAPGHYHELELRLDDKKVWSAPTRMHLERGAFRSGEAYTILTPKKLLPLPEQLH